MTIERAKKRGYRLLTKGSRFFKTDLFYLTKGGFWLGIGKITAVISGLVLSVAFANLLPQDAFGVYQFVLSLAAVVSAFTLTGMRTVINRASARGQEGVLTEGVRTHLKWSIGIAVGAFLGASYYFLNGNQTLGVSLLIIGSFSPFLESFRLYSSFLSGRGEFKKLVTIGIVRKVIPLTVMLGALLVTDDPVLLIFTFFASNTIVFGSIYFSIRRKHAHEQKGELEKEALAYGKHISFLEILTTLSGNLDKILVFHYLGAAQLAVYSFAKILPRQLRGFHQILNPLVFRRVSMMTVPALKKAMPHKTLIVFVASLFIVLAYIPTAPFIYGFLFPQYTDSVLFSQVLALGLLFSPAALYKPVFAAHLKTRQSYAMKTIIPAVRIALLAIFLPIYGMWGAIAAILATQAATFFLSFFLFRRLKE